MKVENKGQEFELIYDNVSHVIPEGEMEINDDGFVSFLMSKARAWGLKVVKLSDDVAPVVKKTTVTKTKKEDKKEEKKTETKKTKSKK